MDRVILSISLARNPSAIWGRYCFKHVSWLLRIPRIHRDVSSRHRRLRSFHSRQLPPALKDRMANSTPCACPRLVPDILREAQMAGHVSFNVLPSRMSRSKPRPYIQLLYSPPNQRLFVDLPASCPRSRNAFHQPMPVLHPPQAWVCINAGDGP